MSNKNVELNKDSDYVEVLPNIVGQISPIIIITVPPTKSYVTFPNSDFRLFLKSVVPADLPDDSAIEYIIEDVSGDQPQRKREYQLKRFNNADQYNTDSQVRLDLDKSYKLAELRKIIVKLNSSVAVDWTQPDSDFMLTVERHDN